MSGHDTCIWKLLIGPQAHHTLWQSEAPRLVGCIVGWWAFGGHLFVTHLWTVWPQHNMKKLTSEALMMQWWRWWQPALGQLQVVLLRQYLTWPDGQYHCCKQVHMGGPVNISPPVLCGRRGHIQSYVLTWAFHIAGRIMKFTLSIIEIHLR